MINTKLHLLEYAAQKSNGQCETKLEAINSIRNIASQIDFTAEIVPIDDPEKLIKLLVSLKGERLNGHEMDVVYEISNYYT